MTRPDTTRRETQTRWREWWTTRQGRPPTTPSSWVRHRSSGRPNCIRALAHPRVSRARYRAMSSRRLWATAGGEWPHAPPTAVRAPRRYRAVRQRPRSRRPTAVRSHIRPAASNRRRARCPAGGPTARSRQWKARRGSREEWRNGIESVSRS